MIDSYSTKACSLDKEEKQRLLNITDTEIEESEKENLEPGATVSYMNFIFMCVGKFNELVLIGFIIVYISNY